MGDGPRVRVARGIGLVVAILSVSVLTAAPAFADPADGDVVPPVKVTDGVEIPDTQEVGRVPGQVDNLPGDDVPILPTWFDNARVGDFRPTQCDSGTSRTTWTSVKKPWAVTHAKRFENFTDDDQTYKKTVTRTATLSSTASVTQGGGISASAAVASLDGQVSFNLAVSGSRTKESAEEVTAKMRAHKVYVFYAGDRSVSGFFTYAVCNGLSMVVRAKGKARSFGVPTEGAVRCGTTPGKDTLARVTETQYC